MTAPAADPRRRPVAHGLPAVRAALAVFAHPDDETFGLGAVLDALVQAGAAVSGLCFTHGEASTLHAGLAGGDRPAGPGLGTVRAAELADAARVLGLGRCDLLGYPDGRLAEVPVDELAAHVAEAARRHGAELLVVFDEGGVTGHPDHRQATRAALVAAADLDLGVLAWAVPVAVADALAVELGAAFSGRRPDEIDLTVAVDRSRQRAALACHRSQSTANPVLHRRLALTGDVEHLRWLRRPGAGVSPPGPPG